MRVTSLKIENHSRLADVELKIREHLVLVGPNDAGKSSILRCLDLVLGASTAQLYSRMTTADFRDPSKPLLIEVVLHEFTKSERALFADEIFVDPNGGEALLTITLLATADDNATVSIQRTSPHGGHQRQLSRDQLAGLGWKFLSATARGRDLRDNRQSALSEILAKVDLREEQDGFDEITRALVKQMQDSGVLTSLREELANQLTRALPKTMTKDDLAFLPGAATDQDVLGDVHLQVNSEAGAHDVTEQSDGMRALYAIALYDLTAVGANVMGIDEPEIHLHPASQRSLARLLNTNSNQKVIATHSPDIVGAFDPDMIAVVHAGGRVVQPATGFLSSDEKMAVRWWVRDRLEPLTARAVLAVEGISDRVIVEKIAEVTDRQLDRLGVSLVETGGAGDMSAIHKLFGTNGFQTPTWMLVDQDAAQATADVLGVEVEELGDSQVAVSSPDLEGEYVSALGADAVWTAVSGSSLFNQNELTNCVATGVDGMRTEEDVAGFCRKASKYKVKAALAVAPLLDAENARAVASVDALLNSLAAQ